MNHRYISVIKDALSNPTVLEMYVLYNYRCCIDHRILVAVRSQKQKVSLSSASFGFLFNCYHKSADIRKTFLDHLRGNRIMKYRKYGSSIIESCKCANQTFKNLNSFSCHADYKPKFNCSNWRENTASTDSDKESLKLQSKRIKGLHQVGPNLTSMINAPKNKDLVISKGYFVVNLLWLKKKNAFAGEVVLDIDWKWRPKKLNVFNPRAPLVGEYFAWHGIKPPTSTTFSLGHMKMMNLKFPTLNNLQWK